MKKLINWSDFHSIWTNTINLNTFEFYIFKTENINYLGICIINNGHIINNLEIPLCADDLKLLSDYFLNNINNFKNKIVIYDALSLTTKNGVVGIKIHSKKSKIHIGADFDNMLLNTISIPISSYDLENIGNLFSTFSVKMIDGDDLEYRLSSSNLNSSVI